MSKLGCLRNGLLVTLRNAEFFAAFILFRRNSPEILALKYRGILQSCKKNSANFCGVSNAEFHKTLNAEFCIKIRGIVQDCFWNFNLRKQIIKNF